MCVVHIIIYNGYMLHMIHTMNYVYMDKVKLICKMNIDRMYMKLTFGYMTYLNKYYVPGTTTITATITMQCTNTIPLKCKSSTADLMIHSSTNHRTTMTMSLLTTISNVLF